MNHYNEGRQMFRETLLWVFATLAFAVLGAVGLFFLSGCSSLPLAPSSPQTDVVFDQANAEDWMSLLTVQPLPENPDDSTLVSVQLGSLRRALNVTNTFDQFVILWPSIVGYILEYQEAYVEAIEVMKQRERALIWKYGWTAVGAGIAGAAVGLVVGLIL